MPVSRLVARGIGFGTATSSFIVTHGFYTSNRDWQEADVSDGNWVEDGAVSQSWVEEGASAASWTEESAV